MALPLTAATVPTTLPAGMGMSDEPVRTAAVVPRLLVLTSVVHYRHEGRIWAYGPYIRELEVWCDLCDTLEIAAACRTGQPPGDALPIRRSNVNIAPVIETGGTSLIAKLIQLLCLPLLLWQVLSAMVRADAVHVRCPGNLGLLGVLLAPLFARRRIAKYAGQWTGYPGEALTYRIQRRVLASRWWNAPVTVYGQWPDQPPHVIPFFSTAFTEEQLQQAREISAARESRAAWDASQPPRVLFVGRLSAAKHVDTLLLALGQLKRLGLTLPCTIVGEGPELDKLRALAQVEGIHDAVEFRGGLEFEQVLACYERADILVLASETEGFPKAILEGMAFGLVCIGSDRGFVPTMLGQQRGLLVAPGDTAGLAAALKQVALSPAEFKVYGQHAAEWARRYSLAHLGDALRELFVKWWPVAPGAAVK